MAAYFLVALKTSLSFGRVGEEEFCIEIGAFDI